MTASTSGLSRAPSHDGQARKAHVLLDPLALLRRIGLAVAALEALDDALEGEHVRALPAHPVPVLDVHAIAIGAEEEQVLLLLGQVLPGRVEIDLVPICDRLDHGLVEARAADRPGDEGAISDREGRVGHQHVRVDLELRPEAGAARAGAVRRIEREDPRLELGQRDTVLGAGEVLREQHRLARVDHVDRDEPLRETGRRLDRLRQPRAQIGLHHEAVDDDLDRVLELLVERDLLLEQPLLPVDLDAREAVGTELLEDVLELALAIAHDRRVDSELRPLLEAQNLVDDRVERLPGDRAAADRTVRTADSRVQESQVVVDLGHRPDCRARVTRRRLLVDRDGR